MATVILFAVVEIIGTSEEWAPIVTSIAAAAAATAGAYIDSTLVYPAVFSKNTKGPRIDDLDVMTASEGTSINFVLGTARVAGMMIWMAPLRQDPHSSGGGKSGSSTTSYTAYRSFAVAIADAHFLTTQAISRVTKIWADSKLIYDNSAITDETDPNYQFNTAKVDSRVIGGCTFYRGAQTTPDSWIESYEGSGNVPAFTGTAYIVFRNLKLTDWGNRCPNLTFMVEAVKPSANFLSDQITSIMRRAGMTSDQFDVSDLTAVTGFGLVSSGPESPIQTLEPLIVAYNLSVQESSGVLVFKRRGSNDSTVIVNIDDIGAVEGGSGPDNTNTRLTIKDTSDFDTATEVDVTFNDITNNGQQGVVLVKNIGIAKNNVQNTQLSLTMGPNQARSIAQRLLFTGLYERLVATFVLPASYMTLQEGDLCIIAIDDQTYTIRVTQIDRGANYINNVQGAVEFSGTLSMSYDADPGTLPPPPPPYIPPDLDFAIIDSEGLQELDSKLPGIYLFVERTDDTQTWGGAALYVSRDGGVNYTQIASVLTESRMGTVSTAIGAGNSTSLIDTDNELSISLNRPGAGLPAASADAFAGLDNQLFLETELVQWLFSTATSDSDYSFKQTGTNRGWLLRGRRNASAAHAFGAQVCIVDGSQTFVQLNDTDVGQQLYFKVVPGLGDISLITPYIMTYQGNTVRPQPPYVVSVVLTTSTQYTFTLYKISRFYQRTVTGGTGTFYDVNRFSDSTEVSVFFFEFYDASNTLLLTQSSSLEADNWILNYPAVFPIGLSPLTLTQIGTITYVKVYSWNLTGRSDAVTWTF